MFILKKPNECKISWFVIGLKLTAHRLRGDGLFDKIDKMSDLYASDCELYRLNR